MIYGVGVDIVEIGRIRDMVAKHGESFLTRHFTPHEVAYCKARKNMEESLAARFAAKEAVMKALGSGWAEGVTFHGIEVVKDESGPPRIQLHGETARYAHNQDIYRIHLSLSHSERYAVAYVVAEENP